MASTSQQSVKTMTDAIIHKYLFGADIPGIADKLFQAQWCFVSSSGRQATVSDVGIAKSVNVLARAFSIPSYAEIDDEQVQVVRELWRPLAPTLLGSRSDSATQNTHLMSPAGAALLSLALIQQKISNPFFQQSSEQFIKAVERMKESGKADVTVQLTASKQPIGQEPPGYTVVKRLASELQRSPQLNRAVIEFFDHLGLACPSLQPPPE